MSNNHNGNFTRIHQQTAVSSSNSSPYKVINVYVNLVGKSAGDLFVLGQAIRPGCIITEVSFYANNTLETGVVLAMGLGEAVLPSIIPTDFTSVFTGPVASNPGVAGTEFNGGLARTANPFTVPAPSSVGQMLFPVLSVTTPVTDPMLVGTVNVKVVYFCPYNEV
jgi:hypothetical protein